MTTAGPDAAGPRPPARVDPLARLRPWLRPVSRAAAATGGWLHRRWRRSLQLRVVLTTLLLSGTVVVLLGVVLLHQIARGLVDGKTRSALAELASGVATAEQQFAAADRTDPASVESTIEVTVNDLANRGSPSALFDVALLTTSSTASGRVTGNVDPSSVPQSLRDAVGSRTREAYVFTPLRYSDGHTGPGLVVGAPLVDSAGDQYQLYYLFPLGQEAQTLSLVQNTVLLTGSLLVLLLAGIAALVTRQVVTPVRLAARTASRFAAGRLEQRMAVRGEDDLARLATSFNLMAANLQQQIRRLEELSRVQQRFVADVSHELRTPLTTVRMAADVLHESRADFPPEVARSAELLQNQLDRFEALLGDLLEISRHDAGAVVLEIEAVDLRALVSRVVEAAGVLAEQRECDVVLDLPATPAIAEVDPRRIERVLRNLLANAIEHGEGRPVEVHLVADADAVVVAVRDHGVGLAPGEASLVFNRFWRADPARSRITGGTGLGLSIALEDTRLHGGWLQAWGEPGKGSQFRLTLPCRAGARLSEAPWPLDPTEVPAPPPPAPAPVASLRRGAR